MEQKLITVEEIIRNARDVTKLLNKQHSQALGQLIWSELSPTYRGGGFARSLVFKSPPIWATLILTGGNTSAATG